MRWSSRIATVAFCGGMALGLAGAALAQNASQCAEPTTRQPPLQYESVVRLDDGRYQFRLCAPRSTAVRLTSGDLPPAQMGQTSAEIGMPMAKDAAGFWTATTAIPVDAGVYGYVFDVDGVAVPDPQAVALAPTWRGVHSVFQAEGPAGKAFSYDAAVSHGLVSVIDYPSTTLKDVRQAHIYTPPGYEGGGNTRYPVLYLVHGAGGRDNSWISIGHANLILDNLIAAGRAKPMIVVMPFAHTPANARVVPGYNPDFGADLLNDLIPYVDKHFRTIPKAADRAMAGLSMGGSHTLNFGLPHPEIFGQVAVFSMGVQPSTVAAYLKRNDAGLKRRGATTQPMFYAIGRDDFLYPTVGPTKKVLDDYKIRYDFHESAGGHTWINWRDYLTAYAPTLFR